MGRQIFTSGPASTKMGTFQNALLPPPPARSSAGSRPPAEPNAPVLARFIVCDKSFIEPRQGRPPGAPRPQAASDRPLPLPRSIASPEAQVRLVWRDVGARRVLILKFSLAAASNDHARRRGAASRRADGGGERAGNA